MSSASTATAPTALPPPPRRERTFDIVIVGAGPSACGLLLGLWEHKQKDKQINWNICLLERGGNGDDGHMHLAGDLSGEEENDTADDHDGVVSSLPRWCAASHTPHASRNRIHVGHVGDGSGSGSSSSLLSRLVDVSTGVGLGGTSRINAGLVIPPAKSDFDTWPLDSQAIMASVETVLCTMRTNQCLQPTCPVASQADYFLSSTPLPLVDNESRPWKEMTFPSYCVHVPCTAGLAGQSPLPTATPRFVRKSYYEALLPSDIAKHVTILTGYSAERLVVDPATHRCTGVEALDAVTGVSTLLRATHDVILCTGALESPALLLAAGIGRTPDLPAGVRPFIVNGRDYKGHVGGHLRDHVMLPRVIFCWPPGPWWDQTKTRALNGVRAMANLLVDDGGDDRTTNHTTQTKVQLSLMDSAAYSDLVPHMVACGVRFAVDPLTSPLPTVLVPTVNWGLRLVFWCVKSLLTLLVVYTPIFYVLRCCVATVAVFLMNAESTGKVSVRLKPSSLLSRTGGASTVLRRSDVDIRIDLGYLSAPTDVRRLMRAWEASDSVYQGLGVEVFPGPLVRKLASSQLHPRAFSVFARGLVLPYFHWMGTCAMKTITESSNDDDDDFVVDEEFRVRGVLGLRICDASIFPTLISAPPALTCAALGHLLSGKLAASYRNQ